MVPTPRQKEAIFGHDSSMVVTAGAGTGKTFVLVEKYLSLIEHRGLRSREILALTFTDKAASEMRERVRSTIARRLIDDPENPIFKAASEEIIIAPIMTFHSFCSQILREFAIEAGLDPGFVILDQGQAEAILRDAFDYLLKRPMDENAHEALIRILSWIEKFRLREILFTISENYAGFGSLFDRLSADPEGLIDTWQQFLEEVREPEISAFFSNETATSAISDLIRFYRRYNGEKDAAVSYLDRVYPSLCELVPDNSHEILVSAACAFLSDKPKGRIGSKKVWDEEDLTRFREAKADMTRILERTLPYFELSLDPDAPFTKATLSFLSDLSLVADQYMVHVTALKNQANGVDFDDLISRTRNFLHENEDLVEKHLRPRFRYILIDEFQDTDPSQFEIISAIIGDLTPDKSSLFIVGDPKQSIYLFRDADVTRFKDAQQRILTECKGKLVNLDTSFRSAPQIIGFVNYLFGMIFASEEKAWEFGYEKVQVCDSRRDSPGSVQILLPPKAPKGSPRSESKEIEAGMVTDLVNTMVSHGTMQITDRNGELRPVTYGDIAILIERRTHLARYMDALSRKDTPFYVHGGIGFYSREEIYDLFNLLSFLLRPYDDASLYGVLRSPYFSLSDTVLYQIVSRKGTPRGSTLFEKVKGYIQAGGADDPGNDREDHLIERAARLLERWVEVAGREPVVLLITKILRESGVLTVYGALPQGDQQVANIQKLVEIVRNRSEGTGYDLSDLVSDMAFSIADEEREGEAAVDTLSQTSVNIMTVHASKGLEFPVVILPDMGSSREGKQKGILVGDNPSLVGVKIPNPERDFEFQETPVYQALSLIRKEKEAAERRRLFYVGATRTRDHLVLCGRQPDDFFASHEESNNRIDWICSCLKIDKDLAESGGIVTIDSGDEYGRIEIPILTDPDEMIREWAHAQLSEIVPPEEFVSRRGEREGNLPEETGESGLIIHSLSRITGADEYEGDMHPQMEIPGGESLAPDETGTILHLIFSGKEPAQVLGGYGIFSEDAVQFCRDAYERFLSHSMMHDLIEDHCELSFIIDIDGHAIEGRMDRLCKNPDGTWMVIDYKSGDYTHADLQLAVYRRAAELLVGSPVSAYVYAILTGEWLEMERMEEEELIRRVEGGLKRI